MNVILKLLKDKKIDNDKIERIKKIIEKYKKENNNDNIHIKLFVKLQTYDLTNVERYKFIEKIYIDLYTLAGYKPYLTKSYVLKL